MSIGVQSADADPRRRRGGQQQEPRDGAPDGDLHVGPLTADRENQAIAGRRNARDHDPLPNFEEATSALSGRHGELSAALSRAKSVRPLAAYHFGVAGQDVVASAALLQETYQSEVDRWLEDERHAAQDPSPIREIVDGLGPGADYRTISTRLQAAMTPEVTSAIGRYLAEMGIRQCLCLCRLP